MRSVRWSSFFLLIILIQTQPCLAEDRVRVVAGAPENQMRVVNTYPEYWVDGKPFFQYAGSFFYYRLPRDRWAEEMLALKAMGLNTLDVLPMWNWHEPEEGQLDFDGHTNPRRDLKYVLELADALGLKVTFRPGPYDTNEWRNGGYPDWLLSRPEYRMSQQAILEGRYPRWSALQYARSDQAASEWLKNSTHLQYAKKYYRDVLGFASPFFADRGGPILSVQMDDDQAIGAENFNGPNFWKYMDTLRKFAKEALNDRPTIYFIDGEGMRLNAEANDALPEPFWNQGQDYQAEGPIGYSTPAEAAKNKYLTELLKTQPLFIPAHIEFQAGWWPGVDDAYARLVDPSNTLMASRVMFQNGLKGLSYFPPDDSINPAGYTVPWSTHFYMWEAALNFVGKETARAIYVRRNGRLVNGMGPRLAASHLLPDAGLVYPMATFPQESMTAPEAQHVSELAKRLLWAGAYEHYNFELVDSDHTPPENFWRYRVLLAPNVVNSPEELKRYPHLGSYSEKAQRLLSDYVNAGGTLIVFPSLPKGTVFDGLLAPFGRDRRVAGDSAIKFSDGSMARTLDAYSVLTLPKKPTAEVKVFARNARGGIVGARVAQGKGTIIFCGADFSAWSLPRGSQSTAQAPASISARDWPEASQQGARAVLPALLKEAGEVRKIYPDMKAENARDLGLYVTELVADSGSLPFERRADSNGYGFIGVTNFDREKARTAQIVLTDPRATDLATSDHLLKLPSFTLPPRESLMLPVRLPLASPYRQMAPGIDANDEVYYSMAELSQVDYDGAILHLELTAPADGEVALRLSRRPEGAKLDGAPVAIREDAERRLYLLAIPHGDAPHFLRKLDISYPQEGPRLVVEPHESWIAGGTRAIGVVVENPQAIALAGELELATDSFSRAPSPPVVVNMPPKSRREFRLPVEIPALIDFNQPVELRATLRSRDSSAAWTWRSQVTVHPPFEFSLVPTTGFPLREDVTFPIVHPTLASLELPGEAVLRVRVKNWYDHEQAVTIAATGDNLKITPPLTQLVLSSGAEQTMEVHAAPQGGSGTYHLALNLRSGDYRTGEEVTIAALAKGDAIAYVLDYDRDGFPDVILENSRVRLFVSPNDGGRAFAFASKATGANAFNSVGGMRDSFTKRGEPEDLRALPDWTRAEWLGLFNRPYAFRITAAAGDKAEVRLECSAPDIYPQGVKLQRTLTLKGDSNYYVQETALTPGGIAEAQAYVLENSVTFKMFNEPQNFRAWFAENHGAEEFVPEKNVELTPPGGFLGVTDKRSGETFALLPLTPAAKTGMAVHAHAATLRFIYPDFAEKDRTQTYRAAYFFGRAERKDILELYGRLKNAAN